VDELVTSAFLKSCPYDIVIPGYSLQFAPDSNRASKYDGEWVSKVLPIVNDTLCVSLNLSVPATFRVSVDLVTNTGTQTVYDVENAVGEMEPTDMLTVFEVQVDVASQAQTHCQLVVRVSGGTLLRKVDIHNDHCTNTGAFALRLHILDLVNGTFVQLKHKHSDLSLEVVLLYIISGADSIGHVGALLPSHFYKWLGTGGHRE